MATEPTIDANSSAVSTGASQVASKAFLTGRSKPSAFAMPSRSSGQPVPFRTMAPMEEML